MEVVLILVVILVLFGAKKIPELAKGLGTGIKEFKKASREDDEVKPAETDAAKAAEAKKQDENTPTHGAN